MNSFLPYIVDGTVIFLLVWYIAKGWHRGFARTVVSMFRWVIAILLAWKLYGYVADFLRQIGVQAKLAASFGAHIQAPAQAGVSEAIQFIEGLMLPGAIKDGMIGNNNYEAYSALGANSFGEYVGIFLANIVVNALAVLLVLVAALLLLRIFSKLLGFINDIPIIGMGNRILGLAVGAVSGFCVIEIWMLIFTMLSTGQNVFTDLVLAIERSTVAVWFYNGNHIVQGIMKIFA